MSVYTTFLLIGLEVIEHFLDGKRWNRQYLSLLLNSQALCILAVGTRTLKRGLGLLRMLNGGFQEQGATCGEKSDILHRLMRQEKKSKMC